MAYAVIGKLAVATVLIFLPALDAAWFRVRKPPAPAPAVVNV
jgi:hypothetical protein